MDNNYKDNNPWKRESSKNSFDEYKKHLDLKNRIIKKIENNKIPFFSLKIKNNFKLLLLKEDSVNNLKKTEKIYTKNQKVAYTLLIDTEKKLDFPEKYFKNNEISTKENFKYSLSIMLKYLRIANKELSKKKKIIGKKLSYFNEASAHAWNCVSKSIFGFPEIYTVFIIIGAIIGLCGSLYTVDRHDYSIAWIGLGILKGGISGFFFCIAILIIFWLKKYNDYE